jgi:hypothetical protein
MRRNWMIANYLVTAGLATVGWPYLLASITLQLI